MIDSKQPFPEYPPRQPKPSPTYVGRNRSPRQDTDMERMASYWYPMSGEAAAYDDDPDIPEYRSTW